MLVLRKRVVYTKLGIYVFNVLQTDVQVMGIIY
jgi:hypothetical protein